MANSSLLKAKFSFITNGGKFITMGIDTKKVQYSNISLLPGGYDSIRNQYTYAPGNQFQTQS